MTSERSSGGGPGGACERFHELSLRVPGGGWEAIVAIASDEQADHSVDVAEWAATSGTGDYRGRVEDATGGDQRSYGFDLLVGELGHVRLYESREDAESLRARARSRESCRGRTSQTLWFVRGNFPQGAAERRGWVLTRCLQIHGEQRVNVEKCALSHDGGVMRQLAAGGDK
jgi:hypothetical protein